MKARRTFAGAVAALAVGVIGWSFVASVGIVARACARLQLAAAVAEVLPPGWSPEQIRRWRELRDYVAARVEIERRA